MFLQKLPCREARMAEQGLPGAVLELSSKCIWDVRTLPVLQETFPGLLRDGELWVLMTLAGFSIQDPLAVAWGSPEKIFWGFLDEREQKRNKFLLGDHCSVESKCQQTIGRGQSLGQAMWLLGSPPEIIPLWNASYPTVISW